MDIIPGQMSIQQLAAVFAGDTVSIKFDEGKINRSRRVVDNICQKTDAKVYGINTGFGKLHNVHISQEHLETLQENLIVSHATGVGKPLSHDLVRGILVLKMNALGQGFSGVRLEVIDKLNAFLVNQAYPVIPSKGSVGASGDLAPLSHLALPILGRGEVIWDNQQLSGQDFLSRLKQQPLKLAAKEGLALINGTQVSLAILAKYYLQTVDLLNSSLTALALTMCATKARTEFLTADAHQIRRQPGQIKIAKQIQGILQGCRWDVLTTKVQDPYSIRCSPQVIGACLQQCDYVDSVIEYEINAVTDNPLVIGEQIVSAGNFHAEPLALAADALANVIAEIGNISERRIAMLMDPSFSGLPAFLVNNSGINSGLMNCHVTASACASENKALAAPRSIDTIPTSMNQEDHVSMATGAALRLKELCANARFIVATEMIAATQGIHLAKDVTLSGKCLDSFERIKKCSPYFENDSYLSPIIEQIAHMIKQRSFM